MNMPRERSLMPCGPSALCAALVLVPVLAVSVPAPDQAGASSVGPQQPESAVSARVIGLEKLPQQAPLGGTGIRTARWATARFETLGVTWRGDAPTRIEVRTRGNGTWSRWRALHLLGRHAADAAVGAGEPHADGSATEPLWVGPSHGVQVQMAGGTPGSTRLVLIDPGTQAGDTASADSLPRHAPRSLTRAPQPRIRSRKAWGAHESWRTGRPQYNATIKQAHIHHTAGTNRYTRSDVPAIIRGDYWYHTRVLGWSDLGYNFVVDKFGRIWAGRAGGIRRAVLGAHTLGFNHASFGVAALGNFSRAKPRPRLVRALVRLTAWKLDRYGRQPAGRTTMTSRGSDRYRSGQRVVLPVIAGHRDTNQTACPGGRLYRRLPTIRRRAQQRAHTIFLPGPLSASASRWRRQP